MITSTSSIATPEPESRSRCWSVSVVIWGMWALLAMYYVLAGNAALTHATAVVRVHGHLRHITPWLQAGDTWPIVNAGRFVWNGALGYVYQATGSSYSLPFSYILTAPIAGIIDHFQLVEGVPYAVAQPSAWLVVAPYSLLYGIPVLVTVRRLAWDLGIRTRLWRLQTATVPLVLLPAFFWGHFDDLLALIFVLAAIRRQLQRDWIVAGILLSLAISAKQWAILAVPLLVLTAPAGKRLKTLFSAAALPSLFTAFVLTADWHDAAPALFSPINLVSSTQGHMSFYARWLGSHTSKYSRALGTVASMPVAWFLRRLDDAAWTLGGLSLLLLLRPFSEAINFSYYWSPGLLFAGLAMMKVDGDFKARYWIAPVAAVLWATPRVPASAAIWWWTGEMLLLALTAWPLLRACGSLRNWTIAGCSFIKKEWYRPILRPMTARRALGDSSWTR